MTWAFGLLGTGLAVTGCHAGAPASFPAPAGPSSAVKRSHRPHAHPCTLWSQIRERLPRRVAACGHCRAMAIPRDGWAPTGSGISGAPRTGEPAGCRASLRPSWPTRPAPFQALSFPAHRRPWGPSPDGRGADTVEVWAIRDGRTTWTRPLCAGAGSPRRALEHAQCPPGMAQDAPRRCRGEQGGQYLPDLRTPARRGRSRAVPNGIGRVPALCPSEEIRSGFAWGSPTDGVAVSGQAAPGAGA